MRTKTPVPVGQGCKVQRGVSHTLLSIKSGTCQCHPDLFLLFCTQCGERFHTSMPQTKTCSDKCRKRLQRSKNDKFLQLVLTYANGNA